MQINEPINIGGRLFIHDIDGHRVFLDTNELFMTLHMIEHHEWEPQIREIIAASLSDGDIYVDVGANIGLHALYAAGFIGERGHVFAFEPNEEVMAILKTNMEINGFYQRTSFFKEAVSDRIGLTTFYVYKEHDGMSGLMAKHTDIPHGGVSKRRVRTATLRKLIPEGTKVDVLKIDVEGYEYAVLKGAGSILDEPNITVIFEWHPKEIEERQGNKTIEDTLALIHEKGFHTYFAEYGKPLKRIEETELDEAKNLWGDLVCTRRDHLERLVKK